MIDSAPKPAMVYVGVGSNMGDSLGHVLSAYNDVAALPGIHHIHRSSLYQSKAVGPGKQSDYVNGVFCFTTSIAPEPLLTQLQTVEARHHRERKIRWGPRTLDLDILLYGYTIYNGPDLTIPHPRLIERDFVILPLLELDPELVLPSGIALKNIHIDDGQLKRITGNNLDQNSE